MQEASVQARDPKSIIDLGAMSVAQWLAVLVTVGLNAMDGFDVLSISFASPGIAHDWGVDKATLGWVLSMELVGMALGSILLGGVADRFGRRPTILACLLAMAVGMFGAAHAGAVPTLLSWRLLTGLGIGGMLAAINAAAAEFSSQRWRSVATSRFVKRDLSHCSCWRIAAFAVLSAARPLVVRFSVCLRPSLTDLPRTT